MVSGGLHHSAAEPVPQQHLLLFHPTKFLEYRFVKVFGLHKNKTTFNSGLESTFFFYWALRRDISIRASLCVWLWIYSLVFNAFCHAQSSGAIQCTLFRQHSAPVALRKEMHRVLHTAGSMLKVRQPSGGWTSTYQEVTQWFIGSVFANSRLKYLFIDSFSDTMDKLAEFRFSYTVMLGPMLFPPKTASGLVIAIKKLFCVSAY